MINKCMKAVGGQIWFSRCDALQIPGRYLGFTLFCVMTRQRLSGVVSLIYVGQTTASPKEHILLLSGCLYVLVLVRDWSLPSLSLLHALTKNQTAWPAKNKNKNAEHSLSLSFCKAIALYIVMTFLITLPCLYCRLNHRMFLWSWWAWLTHYF